MRRAARTDATQTDIMSALRQAGAIVHSLASVGNGMPDLLVLHRGQTILLECKDGRKSPSKRTLTPDQVRFMENWQGGPIAIVDSVEAALRVLRAVTGASQ
jgi:Holliday junction resolvase